MNFVLIRSHLKCPVSKWSSWSQCSHTCGNEGQQIRTRHVYHIGYQMCRGHLSPLKETKGCIMPRCPVNFTFTRAEDYFAYVLTTDLVHLPDYQRYLLVKGHRDSENIVEISVTCLFTTVFLVRSGFWMKWAMYLLCSRQIFVSTLKIILINSKHFFFRL